MRLLVAGLALASVCAAAPASAGGTVWITGRVVDSAGKPVSGAHVSYELRVDLTFFDQANCPVRPWDPKCRTHKVTDLTDAKGRYRLPVRLGTWLASPRSHDVVVTDRSGGAQTHVSVYFTRKSMEMTDLPVWRGRVTFDSVGPSHRGVRVDPLPASLGRGQTQGPDVELLQGSAVVWRLKAVSDDQRIDNRVIEHGTTGVRAVNRAILGRLSATYWSSVTPVAGAVLPVSRGAECATYGKDDAVLSLASCRFTDGKLATAIPQAYQRAGGKGCDVASQCDHPRWVAVDLGALTMVNAVAVRGCIPEAVEVSPAGSVFTNYPFQDLGDGLLTGPAVLAEHVRVDLSRCTFKATEVSVFEPA